MLKKVLITGASEGIGRHFALAFAKQGYETFCVARNADRLSSLVKELPGSNHRFKTADLMSQSGVEAVLNIIEENDFDVLINNAGVGGLGEFVVTPLDRSQEMLRLNIEALVSISHAYLSKARPGAALINVASVLSYLPSPYHAVYAATKAFVKSFSEALWFEQKARDIYVMALCPGATATNFNSRAGGSADRIPAFMIQKPEDVVSEAMRQLVSRSRPLVITGRINRVMRLISKIMPSQLLIQSIGQKTANKENGP